MPEDDSRQSGEAEVDEDVPRSIFVRKEDPRKDLRETVGSVLSDRFMAFLSVILIPIILLPFFVSLSAPVLSFFEICDVTVILLFALEYAAKLYLAKSRWEYFRSPWHLLDLAVILLSFVSYLPLLRHGSAGSSSLLLRLLRLPRALAVGGRTAGSRISSPEPAPVVEAEPPPTVIRQVSDDLTTEHDISWEELQKHLGTKDHEWIDLHNISEEGMLRLSAMLRVPAHHFKAKHVDEIYPHIDSVQQMSFIFLQSGEIKYPESSDSYLTIARRGELIICRGPKIISASPHGIDMFEKALAEMQKRLDQHGFAPSVLYGMLEATLKEYRSIFSEMELEVSRIGSTPRSKLPRDFLQRMYELNKEVTRLTSNMVHFKELLGVVITKRVPLEGFGKSAEEDFKALQDETSFLNDIADDIVDHLRTIIDLYINQSSYETNRILKILAVITALAIIPSAIGGILGMNLLDVPYTFELWQIVVVIVFTMAFIGYCFIKLGWLRP
jgi:Mg2+ and Co2+ transporter CorA